jgi:phosphoribosylaminoimidazole (AIR) synthetase
MGIGMIVVVAPKAVSAVIDAARSVGVEGWAIGSIGAGEGVTYA